MTFISELTPQEANIIVTTADGSHTLFSKKFGEHYHSTFGAIRESEHIFISGALDGRQNTNSTVNILEIGFGTGLNALLTQMWADKNCHPVNYHAVEAYPISIEEAESLNYSKELNIDHELFIKLHHLYNESSAVTDYFTLKHEAQTLEKVSIPTDQYDIIYFDAFSPDVQPELWSSLVFKKLYHGLKVGGVLTTYSCKGDVKRAMKKAGFKIKKLPGPPGKREFLRAIKT